ncbi:MAG: phosphohydrolase [Verrucomicrobiales bacterium]|nr:phosphohydrolase [Verrucomicrobiales bacterium]|tara:strand:+ start:29018 stop:30325 length:1308 start_codon:yes stop_codon:yes gene_type:complete
MQDTAQEIVQNLQEAGYEALFAGGCVRDFLRAVLPKDFDIATSARPDQILELFPEGDTIGAHFGVILVRRAGQHFEIASFREDGDYRDGRRPESVSFATAKKDARRRDFTINGLFYDPVKEELIDYVGGKADIESKIIRAIGDPAARLGEDYLRLLRAIRFATVLDFEIEESTWSAIQAEADNISQIAPERIREELDRIWVHENRLRGFDLLAKSGLMKAIYPEILDLQGCEQPPQWHPEGDVFVHTRLMVSLLPSDASLPLVLSVLFHDIGKPATFSYDPDEDRIRFNGHDKLGTEMTEAILSRLRYSNAIIDATKAGVSNHMAFKDVQRMRTSKLKRFMARETFCDELELHRVDCESSNGNLENYHFLRAKAEEFASEPLIPPPIITGHDLIERDIPSGPRYSEILRRAQDLQLEGTLTSRDEALQWLETELL